MPGRTPAMRATLNSVSYPIASAQIIQQGQILQEVWRDGFVGGAGDYKRSARDTYYAARNMDGSRYPHVRLEPLDQASHTITTLDTTYPIYAFTGTETGGTTKYIYLLNGRYGY